ncbi:putative bifunctional diguanylate cyclase/phosphodiesterase [Aquipuribacter sp. MA13-6]|uniref:putative bifunctional diguanylate cyclase/phosphodiesterase n=1 Tax=unclassified Aquipuribacter TaxID=2635084 RepID=UPI003EEC568A
MLPHASHLPRQAENQDGDRGRDDLRSTDRHRLEEAYALTGLAWWEWDVRTGRLGWSEGMRRLAGLEHLDREPTIEDWAPLLEPADVAATTVLEHQALTAGTPYRHVFRIRTPTGALRYLESWTGPLRDAAGDIVGLRGATLDVSDRESAQRAHHASEAQFQVVFDHAPHGMAMIWLQGDRAGHLIRANDAFARLLGWDRATELLGRSLTSWTPPEERPRSRARFDAMAQGRSRGSAYSRQYLRRDGSVVHAWVTTAVVDDESGVPEFAIAHCIDDTGRRRHVRQLERLARTDALTGLANRSVVDDELASSGPAGPGAVSGLLLMDLDRFKLINDSQGHPVGDALLVQVARRLRGAVPAAHTVARLGGDEFVVVVHAAPDASQAPDGAPSQALGVAEAVVQALREPFDLPGGERVVLTTSVGVALVGDEGSTRDLLKHADLALYEAKDVGRNRVVRFDTRLRNRNAARVRQEALLRSALRHGGLRVELQPVVALADGSVVGAEALVRLDGPDGSPVHTGDLVRVAEETGLVVGLDLWVMGEVARLLQVDAHRQQAGLPARLPGRVAVNVSGRTIEDGDFVSRARAVLAASGASPDRFSVELTETSLLHDSGLVERAVDELVALGVHVGIDDFGTGYSALAYLPRFPLRFLKIDMSFVQRLGTSRRSDAVVAAIVDLAHAHDMTVVAEGVETSQQADALRSMGCEHGQGWLFGRPAPVDLS